jgi:hypothetical protein
MVNFHLSVHPQQWKVGSTFGVYIGDCFRHHSMTKYSLHAAEMVMQRHEQFCATPGFMKWHRSVPEQFLLDKLTWIGRNADIVFNVSNEFGEADYALWMMTNSREASQLRTLITYAFVGCMWNETARVCAMLLPEFQEIPNRSLYPCSVTPLSDRLEFESAQAQFVEERFPRVVAEGLSNMRLGQKGVLRAVPCPMSVPGAVDLIRFFAYPYTDQLLKTYWWNARNAASKNYDEALQ